MRRPSDALGPYPVTGVVDGDTDKVNIDGRTVTLRLIGIDTPETKDPRKPVQCFGEQASARAAELLTGRSVWLEYDPSQDRRDRYGRALVYVWLDADTMFNQVMVQEGYAHEYTYELPYRYQRQFRTAQTAASDAQVGLWNPATCAGDTDQPAGDIGGAATPTPTPVPSAATPATGGGDAAYYSSCAAVRTAGKAPLLRDQPGYRSKLDGDHDGVACE